MPDPLKDDVFLRPLRRSLAPAATAAGLTVAALVASGLTTTPVASAVGTVDPFTSDEFQIASLPAYPATLVALGGRASYHALTEAGTGVEEYGVDTARGPVDDDVLEMWADDEPYPNLATADLAQATDAAVGDLDDDGSVELAYVTPTTLVVTGPQERGFPVAASTSLQGARGVMVLEGRTRTTGTPGADPGVVLVRRERGFSAYRVTGSTLTQVPVRDRLGRDWTLRDSSETLLDAYHRGLREDWDKGPFDGRTQTDPAAAVVLLVGEGSQLETRQAAFTYDPRDGQVEVVEDVAKQLQTSSSALGPWAGGSVSYDWGPAPYRSGSGLGNDPDEDEPVAHVVVAARTSSGTNQVWADGTRVDTYDGSAPCQGSEVPAVDSLYLGQLHAACATVVTRSGADLLRQGYFFGHDNGTRSWDVLEETVQGADRVARPQPQIEAPCLAFLAARLAARQSGDCSSGSTRDLDGNGFGPSLGHGALHTYVSAGSASALAGYLVAHAPGPAYRRPTDPVAAAFQVRAAPGTSATPALAVPLPAQPTQVRLRITNPTSPRTVNSAPVPVAFLAAPPQVAGAGQDADAPEFAASQTSSTTKTKSTETSIGVGIGIEWEDPVGAFGAEVQTSFETNVTDSSSATRDISSSEAFKGLVDQDVVVYNSLQLKRYTGQITSSSTGLALGTTTEVDLPDGGVTSAASVANLARRFPAQFGPTGTQRGVLDAVFTHDVGDPGSYLPYSRDGAAISGYCDGSLGDGPRDLDLPDPLVPANPFTRPKPVEPPRPDVLASDLHQVLVGTGNSEGATFDVGSSTTRGRVESYGTKIEAKGRAAYFTASASLGFAWSDEWESTLGQGVGFASYVGHIPGQNEFLEQEAYDWQSFMCQKTVPTADGPVTAWVLDYTVGDYDGSGGLEPMSEVEQVGPLGSAVEDTRRPTLTFRQDTGTVQSYDVRLEAVGASDVHRRSITFASPAESNRTRQDLNTVVPERDLLPGQLYRWKVTATDFFGNTEATDYEFFRTDGAPRAAIETDQVDVAAGEPVVFHNRTVATDGAQVAYTFDFGDGSTPVRRSDTADVTHVFERSGSFLVRLTAGNGKGDSTDRVRVDVRAVTAPDSYTTAEDTRLVADATTGVLHNDRGSSRVAVARDAAHGALALAADGTFTYAPAADWCGTDTFAYTVGSTALPETATVAVTCTPDAPVVRPDAAVVAEDGQVDLDLLGNDRDADVGDVLRLASARPGHGTLVPRPDGLFRYAPAADWCGTDEFAQSVTDDTTPPVASTVSVVVRCVNDAPVVTGDAVRVAEDGSALVRPLANDTDVDGDTLRVAVEDPAHGTMTEQADGAFAYAPDADWCGAERVAQTVSDATVEVRSTIALTVTCVNDAPVVGPDAGRVDEDGRVALAPLANDVDVDGDPLRLVAATPGHGSLVTGPDGLVDYVPARDFCGTDRFAQTVTDGTQPVTSTITVVVACVDDAPVGTADQVTTPEDTSVAVDPVGNDTDVDDTVLTAVQVSDPVHGSVVREGGRLTYTPDADFCGADAFTYRPRDPAGALSPEPVDVSVAVACVNDRPVARADHFWRVVRADGTLPARRLKVLGNDRDVESRELTARVSKQPAVGLVVMRRNGSFRYALRGAEQPASVTFRYRVRDAEGLRSLPRQVTLYFK